MILSILILSIFFSLFVLFLVFEKWKHKNSLDSIPIRIHVNGTRGKSSVTRLIHSILSEAGWNVFAKTTGSAPNLLFPDRSEKRIFRNKVSISEVISFLNFVSKRKAQAVVVECMAVHPHYQKDSERLLLKATHTVITNVRPDHGEFADSETTVLNGFTRTIPQNGTLVYGRSLKEVDWKRFSPDKKTVMVAGVPKISEDSIQKIANTMRYAEHIENLEVAVAIAEILGIEESVILRGISMTNPDPGALRLKEFSLKETKQRFVFAFAANDILSWEKIFRSVRDRFPSDTLHVVFSAKKERPVRTVDFALFFSGLPDLDTIYFFGPGYRLFSSAYSGDGKIQRKKISDNIQWNSNIQNSRIWIGAGNFEGEGRVWLENQCSLLERGVENWKF
ncbi:poly-gamma-glutamate synthase PgsB [Leptospira stimsonii]|uniref:Poly-gamma-glutamate synthase PgsB n=1 Tax=Leptospira stimsonii TaxID=2202203 RepID=A0ABY2N054_9LEPT|nr:poly-gamma-glutamate synthase PgsB [Leptospira stimsonii]TGK25164.1 poly-gamma-glutamate synthase PgsB [Leptospira stimsonii]TGM13101.1 poly-gamma-glutamate synthase PgsB [Leptospira stimsonii]